MRRIVRTVLLLCGALALDDGSALADPPDNIFVMAKDIGDVITLDPAEVFEFTAGEIVANVYDRLMMFEPEDPRELTGGVAESYAIQDDGETIVFRIRDGLRFHSGNPVRPEDVEFSLERVVKLNKTPAFIFTQFGWNAANVEDLVEIVDGSHVRITVTAGLSPGLVLNALSAGVASVIDKERVLAHETDGDLGQGWLRSHSAGSGAFWLGRWKANEFIALEANAEYRHGAPAMRRVFLRHVPEPSAQRLLLERGDVDMARNLTPDQIRALAGHAELAVDSYPKGAIVYLAANTSHPVLGNPAVVQALRHAIDYRGMADSFLAGQFSVHQAFWPAGLWASYTATPYELDIEKARSLLGRAELVPFEVRIDTLTSSPFPQIAQSIQATFAEAGIDARIVMQDGKTLWPRYRARKHELIVARWSPDYMDPHSNADAFAHNPDNRPEAMLAGVLAWRNAWASEEINERTIEARDTQDLAAREAMYLELQKRLQTEGPYAIMFQQSEQVVRRRRVEGFMSGVNFDHVYYRNVTK